MLLLVSNSRYGSQMLAKLLWYVTYFQYQDLRGRVKFPTGGVACIRIMQAKPASLSVAFLRY